MSTHNPTNGRPGPYYWLANPCILPIHPYKPGKQIAEVKKELGLDSIIKLASNENPAGPSPLALLALESALRDINFYPEDGGIELKRGLADKCGISSNNIILGHGATEVLDIIVRTFVCPEDEVISAHPSFPWFQMLGQMSGAKNVIVPLREHTHDLKAMADSITPKTKLIFIANPNNPTGTIVGQDELEAFLKVVPSHVVVVLDEAYTEYVTGEQNDTIRYIWRKPVIIVRTFSKFSGLAGLRIGYAISGRWIIDLLEKVRAPFNTAIVSQAAALASLEDHDHRELTLRLVEEGKAFLYAQFEELGLDFVPSEANFIFVDFHTDAEPIFKSLLSHGFIIRQMLKTCARITIGTPEQNAGLVHALRAVISGGLSRKGRAMGAE
ncbi:MAG TPA: histidinol-phosphate transaminase [Blastocatellia bacterium]|nr:histidinol-phosphate transaminase [Blastocatellia bacterium]